MDLERAPGRVPARRLAAVLACAWSASGCNEQLSLEARPCPCAEGWTCCEQTNVCVRQGRASPPETDCCQQCQEAFCEEQNRACSEDPECRSYRQCLTRAGCMGADSNPGCIQACADAHPDTAGPGGSSWKATECWKTNCESQCGYGMHWGCVGKYRWPEPAAAFAKATLGIYTWFGKPVSELLVRACDRNDLSCPEPVAQSVTNAGGQAYLELPLAPSSAFEVGFNGFFDLTQPATPVAPALLVEVRPWTASGSRAVGLLQADFSLADFGPFPIVPGRAHIFVLLLDCTDAGAIGMRLETQPTSSDSSTYPLYTANGAPESGADRTLGSNAAILNVLTTYGQVEVAAWNPASDELVACERIPVRPDVISYAILMSPLRSADDAGCAWRR
jgi:hypothetical protein